MAQSKAPNEASIGLKELRKQIREIDDKLLDLVAHRMQLSRQVGQIKQRQNLPIKDYQVERDVLARIHEKARELGLFEELAQDLARTLIKYSCLLQEKEQDRTPGEAR